MKVKKNLGDQINFSPLPLSRVNGFSAFKFQYFFLARLSLQYACCKGLIRVDSAGNFPGTTGAGAGGTSVTMLIELDAPFLQAFEIEFPNVLRLLTAHL